MKSKKKIIIVDDEQTILDLLEQMILKTLRKTELDCLILTFSKPEDVLALGVDIREVILVISDYNMPGMDGIELIKEIKKVHPEIKVIMMSGIDFKEALAKTETEKDLVNVILSKPFVWKNFQNLILEILQ